MIVSTKVCISCTRLLRTSCNTFILTQRFITYHRFHSLTTLHNKLFHKLSLHISCYAQQAEQFITVLNELSLILLHFNCRSHSSFAVRSSNPCLQFFTITHALINQPCHHGINCPPYAVWLTMHHTDRRLQTGASLLRSSFNASWNPITSVILIERWFRKRRYWLMLYISSDRRWQQHSRTCLLNKAINRIYIL